MHSFKFAAAAIIAGMALTTVAHAGTVAASSAAGARLSPFTLGDFGTSSANGLLSTNPIQIANSGEITFSPNGSTPQAGLYSGSVDNVATAPTSGTFLPSGNYLAAEPNDNVNIKFGVTQTSLSLLWGSVDTYNGLNLNFLDANNKLVGSVSVSGSAVATAIGGGFAANGTTPAFVTITPGVAFNQVVLTSTSAAFEFVPSVQVPEPASLAVLGMGMACVGLVRRRRAARA